jgi:hypothetical protein
MSSETNETPASSGVPVDGYNKEGTVALCIAAILIIGTAIALIVGLSEAN